MTAAVSSPAPTEPAVAPASLPSSEPPDLAALLREMQLAQRKAGPPAYEERIRHLTRLEETLLRRKDEIALAIQKDYGARSLHESLIADVWITVQGIRYVREHLREWMDPEERSVSWAFLPGRAEVRYQPLGVVGIIAPWNYPVQLALAPLAGALAAGNRAIVKPSELVPLTCEALRSLVAEIFDEHHVAVVTGGSDVGEALTRLPFDHLVFTGSTRVGRAVMRAAAENLTPLTLELGGKSPVVVDPTCSVASAAKVIVSGKLFNAGQTCIAPDYVFVHETKKDELVKSLESAIAHCYPTLAKNPQYTSVINAVHHARLVSTIDDARSKGATIIEVNPAKETFDPETHKLVPTLVLGATEEMVVMQEEIFGPVLPILTYKSIDDVIAYVNEHPRPLALYYLGHDEACREEVLARTVSGGVSVNATMLHVAQDDLPFGGVGASGMGAYHAREGFETFSRKKPVFHQSRINSSGIVMPPFGRAADLFLRFVLGKSKREAQP